MANDFTLEIPAQPYWGCKNKRNVTVYFSMPEDEIIEESNQLPGICLLVAGFGGESTASVFAKMRNKYADKHNLIMVQCDYMGFEFMGKSLQMEKDQVMHSALNNPLGFCSMEEWEHYVDEGGVILNSKVSDNETRDNFSEMGMFQALDCIRALVSVIELLNNIGVEIDSKKIIGYGFSQGAYLLYLMNAMFPELFTLIIDNSAWIVPKYLEDERILFSPLQIGLKDKNGVVTNSIITFALKEKFHALQWIEDLEAYDLRIVCAQMSNKAKIISFHGVDDNLVSIDDKKMFLSLLENVELKIVSDKDIDGKMFKSTSHGLDADFLELFEYVVTEDNLKRWLGKYDENRDILVGATFKTSKYIYKLAIEDGLPVINREVV